MNQMNQTQLPANPKGYCRNQLATLSGIPHSSIIYWIASGKVGPPKMKVEGITLPRYSQEDFIIAYHRCLEIQAAMDVIDGKKT